MSFTSLDIAVTVCYGYMRYLFVLAFFLKERHYYEASHRRSLQIFVQFFPLAFLVFATSNVSFSNIFKTILSGVIIQLQVRI